MKCIDKARVMAKHLFQARCMVGRFIAKYSHAFLWGARKWVKLVKHLLHKPKDLSLDSLVKSGQVWWYAPLIPLLGRQTQQELSVGLSGQLAPASLVRDPSHCTVTEEAAIIILWPTCRHVNMYLHMYEIWDERKRQKTRTRITLDTELRIKWGKNGNRKTHLRS